MFKRNLSLLFVVLFSISIILSGCGRSAYYIDPPKGSLHNDQLTAEQAQLVDACIKTVINWYNKIDISQPQNFDTFMDEDAAALIRELHLCIHYTDDAAESTELNTASDAFDMVIELLDTSGYYTDETFTVSEKDWLSIRSSLLDVIDYFYD